MPYVVDRAESCPLPDGKEGVRVRVYYTSRPGPEDIFPEQTADYCDRF